MTLIPRLRILLASAAIVAALPLLARDWFVDNAAAPGGDGSASAPLQSLRAVEEASGPGDAILLRPGSGPYRESITLKEAQTLSGSGGRPVIAPEGADAIVLAPRTTVTGLTIRTAKRAAVRGTAIGENILRDLTIEGSGDASGIVLAGITGAVTVEGLNADGGAHAIVLEKARGRVDLTASTIRNVSQRGIVVRQAENVTLRNVTLEQASTTNGTGCGRPTAADAHLRCNAALYLHDATNVVLEAVRIRGAAQNGIHGDVVRNFSMVDSELVTAGDELDEAGVLLRNATGNVRFTGTRIEESAARQIEITNDTGEAIVEVRRATIGNAKTATGQQGMLVSAGGDARLRLTIEESTFAGNVSSAIHVIAAGSSVVNANVANSRFQRNGSALVFAPSDAAKLDYRIDNNTIAGNSTTAVTITSTSAQGSTGTVVRNTVGVAGETGSGASCGGACSAIMITGAGRGSSSALVAANTLQQIDSGIRVRSGDTGTLDVRITGNTIRERAAGDRPAIVVQAGMRPKDSARICADVGGAGALANTVAWPGPGAAMQFVHKFPLTKLFIAGYAGSTTAYANAAKFVATRNRGAAVATDITVELSLADQCNVPQEN
ncbi:MAG TPA: right-handed parallel beta-helix repeat-containing protein [Thermoanaerobaculia bacterium]|nr:right-handed parallel beta-helix repeat-containing protein [Thermoanaerobaculia bacterium]